MYRVATLPEVGGKCYSCKNSELALQLLVNGRHVLTAISLLYRRASEFISCFLLGLQPLLLGNTLLHLFLPFSRGED